tara:strand:- start:5963 stop:7354 length:1392 start_codon:yes stop_codon:yes gene_type:complete
MGADASLIKAAAQMGPKAWDYSGIMKGIAALGKYALEKRKVANELTTYGDKEFQIKEMPDEMLSGPFGEENAEFFTNMKKAWSEMTEVIKNPLNTPSSKKYKNAVKTINTLKASLEKNKADLLVWAEVRKKVNENWANASKGIGRQVFHRVADLQINNTYGEMNAATMFTLDGIKILASSDVGMMDGTSYSPSEIMDGFFVNQMSLNSNSKNLTGIIAGVGEKRKNAGKGWNEAVARTEINAFVQTMKDAKYGGNGIKSLAFDYSNDLGGGTFVQANKAMFIDPSKNNQEAELSYVEQYKKVHPDATADEIELAYSHQAADVWSDENSSEYEAKLVNWLVGAAKQSYNQAESKEELSTKEESSIKLDWTGNDNSAVYLRTEQIPSIVEGIKDKTNFTVDGTRFKFINNQWEWDANGKFEPVTGAEGQNYNYKDGSNDALAYRLGNNKQIVDAFKDNKLPKKKK